MHSHVIPIDDGRCGFRRRIAPLLLSGLLLIGAPIDVAMTQITPAAPRATAASIADHITAASQRFGIPEHWIRAVLRAESAGDLRAVSSAGAIGLMQVMPDTWAELRLRHGLGQDPFDARDNILAGTAYLREMFDRYGDIAAMLAAYNAGPGRYDAHLATGRPLPAETRAYVAQLAPILGAETPSVVAVAAPPPPPDWREAPLFVVRSTHTPTVERAPSAHLSGDTLSPLPVQPARTSDIPQAGVIVARSGGGGLP